MAGFWDILKLGGGLESQIKKAGQKLDATKVDNDQPEIVQSTPTVQADRNARTGPLTKRKETIAATKPKKIYRKSLTQNTTVGKNLQEIYDKIYDVEQAVSNVSAKIDDIRNASKIAATRKDRSDRERQLEQFGQWAKKNGLGDQFVKTFGNTGRIGKGSLLTDLLGGGAALTAIIAPALRQAFDDFAKGPDGKGPSGSTFVRSAGSVLGDAVHALTGSALGKATTKLGKTIGDVFNPNVDRIAVSATKNVPKLEALIMRLKPFSKRFLLIGTAITMLEPVLLWMKDGKFDDPVRRAFIGAVSSLLGGWAGAELGGIIGGAIGSIFFPGAGTIIGGVLGILGGVALSAYTQLVGETLFDIVAGKITVQQAVKKLTTEAWQKTKANISNFATGVKNVTQGALGHAAAVPTAPVTKPSVAPTAPPASIPSAGTKEKPLIEKYKHFEKDDPDFIAQVYRVSDKYQIDPNDLMGVMENESGPKFDPAIKNPKSSATGLIQFMNSTAKDLGTTTEALSKMTRAEQMVYVDKYFEKQHLRKGATRAQLYTTVVYPHAVSDDDKSVLFSKGSEQYKLNAHLDTTGKGYVTQEDLGAVISRRLGEAGAAISKVTKDVVDKSKKAAEAVGKQVTKGMTDLGKQLNSSEDQAKTKLSKDFGEIDAAIDSSFGLLLSPIVKSLLHQSNTAQANSSLYDKSISTSNTPAKVIVIPTKEKVMHTHSQAVPPKSSPGGISSGVIDSPESPVLSLLNYELHFSVINAQT